MEEKQIGVVENYMEISRKLASLAIRITDDMLSLEDTIHIKGPTTSFMQKLNAMQLGSQPVDTAQKGDRVVIRINSTAKTGDLVYKVISK